MASTLDPHTLYRACRSVDRAERAAAYQQLGEFLLRVALSRLKSKPDLHPQAEECAQEALTAIWQKLEAGQGPDTAGRFLSWAATIVIHKVFDMLRREGFPLRSEETDPGEIPGRKKRVPRRQQESFEQLVEYEDGPGDPWQEQLPDPQPSDPEIDFLQREGAIELLLGIREHPHVSDDSKIVLLDGFLADMADEELASRLNTSRSNIRVIRYRNLNKLRDDVEFLANLRPYYEGND